MVRKKRRHEALAPGDLKRMLGRAVVCSPAEGTTQARGLLGRYFLPDSLESCQGEERRLEHVRDYNLAVAPVGANLLCGLVAATTAVVGCREVPANFALFAVVVTAQLVVRPLSKGGGGV